MGSYIYKHWNNFNNIEINVVDYPVFDITNSLMCEDIVKNNDIIINCAAYTLVDKAEEDYTKCMLINSFGPMYLALFCKKYDKKLIHISSESIYGSNDLNYIPLKESDNKFPKNVYSISKLNGDINIQNIMKDSYIILRAGWLFGPNNDHNFIEKIKQLLLAKSEIKVVDDQIGSLTSVELISNAIKNYLNENIEYGTYNIANEGYTSRYENAVFIKNIIKSNCIINECTSNEFKRKADIAKNSCLDCSKLKSQKITFKIPTWKEDVEKVLEELL